MTQKGFFLGGGGGLGVGAFNDALFQVMQKNSQGNGHTTTMSRGNWTLDHIWVYIHGNYISNSHSNFIIFTRSEQIQITHDE